MRKRALRIRHPRGRGDSGTGHACSRGGAGPATDCSAWLIESSRFMNVPFGSFMPDRAFVPGSTSRRATFRASIAVNVGVIKCGNEFDL